MLYQVIRPILYLFFKIRYNPTIINKENIPLSGKCILAGNHTNNLDFLPLGYATKRNIKFVAKNDLIKGVKKYFFKSIGIIPVNREIKDRSVIPACVNLLNNNNIIAIFPEGTINKSNEIIMPFKYGAVVMSQRSNAPIIPFAINGIYQKNKLKIIFGEPYYVKTTDVIDETKKLEDKVIELIKSEDIYEFNK